MITDLLSPRIQKVVVLIRLQWARRVAGIRSPTWTRISVIRIEGMRRNTQLEQLIET